jgi:hypothetical protein
MKASIDLLTKAAITEIPMTSVFINEPSKVSFIVPADLAAGQQY